MSPMMEDTVDAPVEGPHSLTALITNLRNYLGTKSGINSSEIDVNTLESFLEAYKPTSDDWTQFGQADLSRNYTRLLVDSINHKSNLLFLLWNPSKGSPIHDHADAHCVMKIIKGSLSETLFHNPPDSDKAGSGPLEVKRESTYHQDQVTYISDDIGLHRIANPNEDEIAVSLHLYTPPNAADIGYGIYDQNTGKRSFIPGSRYTC